MVLPEAPAPRLFASPLLKAGVLPNLGIKTYFPFLLSCQTLADFLIY